MSNKYILGVVLICFFSAPSLFLLPLGKFSSYRAAVLVQSLGRSDVDQEEGGKINMYVYFDGEPIARVGPLNPQHQSEQRDAAVLMQAIKYLHDFGRRKITNGIEP